MIKILAGCVLAILWLAKLYSQEQEKKEWGEEC